MNRFFTFTVLLFYLFSMVTPVQSSAAAAGERGRPLSAEPTEWTIYRDSKYNFSVNVPADWFVYPANANLGSVTTLSTFPMADEPDDLQSGIKIDIGMLLYAKPDDVTLANWVMPDPESAAALQYQTSIPVGGKEGIKQGFGTQNEYIIFVPGPDKSVYFFAVNNINQVPANSDQFTTANQILQTFLTSGGSTVSLTERQSLYQNDQSPVLPQIGLQALSGYRLPFAGTHTITSGPGCYSTHTGRSSEAIDFSMSLQTRVLATTSGTVAYAVYGWNDGFGNLLKLQHNDGNIAWYAHLDSFVATSGTFSTGQHIALSGNTGNSTGPHLHFEVRNSSNTSIWMRDLPGISWYSGDPNNPCQAPGNPDGTANGPAENTSGGSTVPRPSEAIQCAGEGGYCSFNGTATVYYGANDKYFKKDNVTNGIVCNNDVFGDPLSGVTKACYYVITGGSSGCPTVSGEVRLYDLTNCGGAQTAATSTGLWQYESSFNDKAESIAVPGGWSARLFVDNSESSASACITSTDTDLSNNTFSSGGTVANATTWMRVYANNSCTGDTPSPNGSWNARYFSGSSGWWDPSSLSNATPSCTETLSGLDKNYGSSAPCGGMNGDDWVGEYTATINFPAGNYVFIADHDDGFKLYRDGTNNIAERGGSGSNDYICPARYLSGNVNLKAMLREEGGDARVKLTWSPDTSLCVSKPSAPSLQNPADGDTYNENQPVTLSWSATGDQYYGEITGGPNTLSFGWQSATSNNIGAQWAGYTYTWHVKANNSAGDSDWSSTRTFTVLPAAPAGLNASAAACKQVNLTWSDNSGNEDGYKVYRNGSLIATLGAGANSYQDTSTSASTSYSYTVYAYRGSLNSPVSNTASVTTPVCGAGVPALVSPSSGMTFDEGQAITLTWTATGAEYYGEVSGGPAGTTSFGWQTGTSKVIGAQWAGYTYSWRVKARNAVSTSDFSSPNTFTVRPAQPTNLSATSPACGRVNLSWSDNSGSEEGYLIYRDGSWQATVGSNVTSFQDNAVGSETSYTYTVYAYRGSIQSAASAPASVTTKVCPPSNDNIASAIAVSPAALPYTNTQSTRGATLETGEPAYPVGTNLGASVWYRFTPTVTGAYAFDTHGSGYDTVLTLFERSPQGVLTAIQGSDDDAAMQVNTSKIIFTGQANTTYLFSITQFNSSEGGPLTVHLDSVVCPAGSLCTTVTSPFYRAFGYLWIGVYDSAGNFVARGTTDYYGYATISGLPAGTYQVIAAGWNMLRTVNGVPSSGYLDITGVGLPSMLVSLKDLNGTQIEARAYLQTSTGDYYVGISSADGDLVVYASPADYLLTQVAYDDKYIALKDITVQPGMQSADMSYNVAEYPAQTFQYHLQTIPSVELLIWHGNIGSSVVLSEGQTAVVSFPAGKTYPMDHIAMREDSTEYWYYEFRPRDLTMQTVRESSQVSIGGSLKIDVSANGAPYGRGDVANIGYTVRDSFDNTLWYIWPQAKAAASPAIEGSASLNNQAAAPVRALKGEAGETIYQRVAGGFTPQTLGNISSAIQILNPSSTQVYQETQSNWYGGTNWTLPAGAPLGVWTARVTANHLGLWQGQTVGQQTFEVKSATPPDNDDISAPRVIYSLPYTTTEDTFGATQANDDPAMPNCGLLPAQATVWFRYQAAQSGTLHVDTMGSDYDTVLAVWSGSRGALSAQGCNDDRVLTPRDQDSQLVVPVSAGTSYYIMVGKFSGVLSQGPALEGTLAGAKAGIALQTAGAGIVQLHVTFSAALPGAAQLISPKNAVFLVRTPVFTWSPDAAATEYDLQVYNSQGQLVLTETLSSPAVCQASICSYQATKQLVNGSYTWRVLTKNSLGYGPWSETLGFQVNARDDTIRLYIPSVFKLR